MLVPYRTGDDFILLVAFKVSVSVGKSGGVYCLGPILSICYSACELCACLKNLMAVMSGIRDTSAHRMLLAIWLHQTNSLRSEADSILRQPHVPGTVFIKLGGLSRFLISGLLTSSSLTSSL